MSGAGNIDNVLIVDDDQILQEVLGAFMSQRGAGRVLHATDGNVALEQLWAHEEQIQLIFCDLNMPNKDGIEFLIALGQANTDIPIIIVSSAGQQTVRSADSLAMAYGLNLVATLSKPINFAKLAELVDKIGQTERQIA